MIFPTVFPSPENGSLFSGICVQLFHINDLPYGQWAGLLLMAYWEVIKSAFMHPFAMNDVFTRVVLTPIALFLYGALAMAAANFGMIVYIGSKFFALFTKEGEQMVAADLGYTAVLIVSLLVWSYVSMMSWSRMLNWFKRKAAELEARYFKYGRPLTIAIEEYEAMCIALTLLANLVAVTTIISKKPKPVASKGA